MRVVCCLAALMGAIFPPRGPARAGPAVPPTTSETDLLLARAKAGIAEGDALFDRDEAAAEKRYRQGLADTRRHLKVKPDDLVARELVFRYHGRLGIMAKNNGAYAQAVNHFTAAITEMQSLLTLPTNTALAWRHMLGATFRRLGDAHIALKQADKAMAAYHNLDQQAQMLMLVQGSSPETMVMRANALRGIAGAQVMGGDNLAGQQTYIEASKISRAILEAEPGKSVHRERLCHTLLQVGRLYMAEKAFSEAAETLEEAELLARRLYEQHPEDPAMQLQWGEALLMLAVQRSQTGRVPEAKVHVGHAVSLIALASANAPEMVAYRVRLGQAQDTFERLYFGVPRADLEAAFRRVEHHAAGLKQGELAAAVVRAWAKAMLAQR